MSMEDPQEKMNQKTVENTIIAKSGFKPKEKMSENETENGQEKNSLPQSVEEILTEDKDLNRRMAEARTVIAKSGFKPTHESHLHEGVDNQFLPQYKEMALREMEKDFAERIVEADSSEEKSQLAKDIIKTQESVADDNKNVKRLSLGEWIKSKQFENRDAKEFDVSRESATEEGIERAAQENLDRATEKLDDLNVQIEKLNAVINSLAAKKKFGAIPDLADTKLKGLEQQRDWRIQERDRIKDTLDALNKKEDNIPTSESPLAQKVEEKNNLSKKETPSKTTGDGTDKVETRKGVKRELPGWLKAIFQGIGGLALITFGAIFGFLEKQIPGGRKGKKE